MSTYSYNNPELQQWADTEDGQQTETALIREYSKTLQGNDLRDKVEVRMCELWGASPAGNPWLR